jgi:hypothetical protein
MPIIAQINMQINKADNRSDSIDKNMEINKADNRSPPCEIGDGDTHF